MSEFFQRIASLSPAKQELLMRKLREKGKENLVIERIPRRGESEQLPKKCPAE